MGLLAACWTVPALADSDCGDLTASQITLDAGRGFTPPCNGYFVPEFRLREMLAAEETMSILEKQVLSLEGRALVAEDRADRSEARARRRNPWRAGAIGAALGIAVMLGLILIL